MRIKKGLAEMEIICTCCLIPQHFTVLGAYFVSVSKAPPPVVQASCSCFLGQLGLASPTCINNPPQQADSSLQLALGEQSQLQLIRQVAQLIILAALAVLLALFKGKWACAQNEAERMLVAVLFPFYYSTSFSLLFSPLRQEGGC